MRRNRHRPCNPLFAKRWFSDDVILVSVTWYLRFKLSYRDLAPIMDQMGVTIASVRFCARWCGTRPRWPNAGNILRNRSDAHGAAMKLISGLATAGRTSTVRWTSADTPSSLI